MSYVQCRVAFGTFTLMVICSWNNVPGSVVVPNKYNEKGTSYFSYYPHCSVMLKEKQNLSFFTPNILYMLTL